MWHSLITYVPRVKARVSPERAVRRFAAAFGGIGRYPDQVYPRSARKLQVVPGRQRPVPVHRQCVPLRPVQEHHRQGAGVRAGLARPATRAVHEKVADILAEVAPPLRQSIDPESATGFQGARDRQRRRGSVCRQHPPAGGVPAQAARTHRPHRHAGAGAGALCFLETTAETVHSSPRCCARMHRSSALAATLGDQPPTRRAILRRHIGTVTTSATRRWSSRTSPPRCRAWSTTTFRCSSFRKPPRCAFPRSRRPR